MKIDNRIKLLINIIQSEKLLIYLIFAGMAIIYIENYTLGYAINARKKFEKSFGQSHLLIDVLHFTVLHFTQKLLKFLFKCLVSYFQFEIDSLISTELLKNLLNADLENFSKNHPEDHLTVFNIRRKALKHFCTLIIFSIPENIFSIVYESYKIITCNSEFRIGICLSLAILIIIYMIMLNIAIKRRSIIRKTCNSYKVKKNRICREVLDSFESIKADLSEKKVLKKFVAESETEAYANFKYFFESEFYRLITRFSVLILKAGFIVIALEISRKFGLREVMMRINIMNGSLLRLRNDSFYLLEYWLESIFIEFSSEKNEKQFLNENSIIADKLKIEESKNTTKQYLKRSKNDFHVSTSLELEQENNLNKTFKNVKIDPVTKRLSSSISRNRSEDKKLDLQNNLLEIQELNFEIPPKSKVLIVCPSNQTKSFISKALIRQIPYTGSLKIGNSELSFVRPEIIYRSISYLSESRYIFNKSILYNILYGTKTSATIAKSRLNYFGLSGYFNKFTNGLNTVVGNSAYGLSNGQVQMICFCRTILKESSIYIFDEPCMFLDNLSIRLIYDAIKKIDSDKTVLVLTKSDEMAAEFNSVIRIG